jgi:hypothetical protein
MVACVQVQFAWMLLMVSVSGVAVAELSDAPVELVQRQPRERKKSGGVESRRTLWPAVTPQLLVPQAVLGKIVPRTVAPATAPMSVLNETVKRAVVEVKVAAQLTLALTLLITSVRFVPVHWALPLHRVKAKPALGVAVNVTLPPAFTTLEAGLTLPPPVLVPVTVNVAAGVANRAMQLWSALTLLRVSVGLVDDEQPDQRLKVDPALGRAVSVTVPPLLTVQLDVVHVPPTPVTVPFTLAVKATRTWRAP